MRSGPRFTAAGRPTPGPSPLLAFTSPTYFPEPATLARVVLRGRSNRPTRKTACRAGCSRSRITARTTISNRHLVQLKFTATHPNSTTSLFLIVTKQHDFRGSAYTSSRAFRLLPLNAFLIPLCECFPASSHPHAIRTARVSNRHLVQLEFA